MKPLRIASVPLMGGLLICVINEQESQTTYLTAKRVVSGQSTLTLAYLTTKQLVRIWQISYDNTGKILAVSLT
jgi:hypothetical protein